MTSTIWLLLMASLCLIVQVTDSPFAKSSANSQQVAGQRAACASSAGQIASANPALPNTVQSVESYYSASIGRCFVLISRRPSGIGKVLPTINYRILYDGHTGQVLAIASDENGARTGRVLDPEYKQPANVSDSFDAAVAYIKTRLD